MRALTVAALLLTTATLARAMCPENGREECAASVSAAYGSTNANEICSALHSYILCTNTKVYACSNSSSTISYWDASSYSTMWDQYGCSQRPGTPEGELFSGMAWGDPHYLLVNGSVDTCTDGTYYSFSRKPIVTSTYYAIYARHSYAVATGSEGKTITQVDVEFKYPTLPSDTYTWTATSAPYTSDREVQAGITVGPNSLTATKLGLLMRIEVVDGSLTVGIAGKGALGGILVNGCDDRYTMPATTPSECSGVAGTTDGITAACAYDASQLNGTTFAVAAATSAVTMSGNFEADMSSVEADTSGALALAATRAALAVALLVAVAATLF